MARIPRTPRRGSPRRLLGALVLVATLAPALAWKAVVIAVASLSLSPTDVASGTSSTGTVRLDSPPASIVTVQLSSANPSLATVPSSLTFSPSGKITSKSFTVQTASGAAGCTEISAKVGTTTARKALIAVKPASSSSLNVRFSSNPAVGGQTVTGTVTFLANTIGERHVVRLSSSHPTLASVPASITVTTVNTESAIVGVGTFPVTTSVTGSTVCPVITATVGDPRTLTIGGNTVYTSGALLKLVSISG